MVANSYYTELKPTGRIRVVDKRFGVRVELEYDVYIQPMNPFTPRTVCPAYKVWEKFKKPRRQVTKVLLTGTI
jgi:hypothetical protein